MFANIHRKNVQKIVSGRVNKILDLVADENIGGVETQNTNEERIPDFSLPQQSAAEDLLDFNLPTTGIILDKDMNLQTLLLTSTESMCNKKNENQISIYEEENDENMNQDPMQVIDDPIDEDVTNVTSRNQTSLSESDITDLDQPSTSTLHTLNNYEINRQQLLLVDYSDDSDGDPNYIPSSEESSYDEDIDSQLKKQEDADEVNNPQQFDIDEDILDENQKPKKRQRRMETWKVTRRSAAARAGLEHKSKSGKTIKAKNFKPGCAPCRKKCTSKINEATRQLIFEAYWNEQKTWDLKRQFVRSHITTKPTQRHRPKDNSRNHQRKQTISYHFDVKTDHLEKIEVCKVFFLNTLGISETVVLNALKKNISGGFVAMDMRGRHVPSNKLSEEVLDRVRSHINSFPSYESHYSRRKSTKKYLGPELNREKMYKLYLAKCDEDKVPKEQVAKLWIYKKIFNSEFSLGFKTPSADTCDTCDKFVLNLKNSTNEEEKSIIQKRYDDHLQDADMRYELKKSDKENSKNDPEKIKVVMLDLQKCLPTPYLTNNQSFYCLKLWTLNLTIYDATTKKSYCMVWNESEAGRGGHEIASALLKWASIVISNSPVEHLIIWSDNCPSQNRNVMVMMSYFWLLNVCPNLKTVEHKFLLKGHTHMEADHIHAVIERSIKKQPTMEICTPWDWEQLIRSTGANVLKMNLSDFKNFEVLYNQPKSPFVSKKVSSEKEQFLISTVVNFQVRSTSPNMVFYKQSFLDEDFKSLNVARSARSKQVVQLPVELPDQRKNLKGISKKKHTYLTKLLEWVPVQFHDFYKNIPVSQTGDNEDSD